MRRQGPWATMVHAQVNGPLAAAAVVPFEVLSRPGGSGWPTLQWPRALERRGGGHRGGASVGRIPGPDQSLQPGGVDADGAAGVWADAGGDDRDHSPDPGLGAAGRDGQGAGLARRRAAGPARGLWADAAVPGGEPGQWGGGLAPGRFCWGVGGGARRFGVARSGAGLAALCLVFLAGAAWCLRETLVGLARRRPLADIVGDGLLHALLLVLLLKLFWILAIDPLRLGRPQ